MTPHSSGTGPCSTALVWELACGTRGEAATCVFGHNWADICSIGARKEMAEPESYEGGFNPASTRSLAVLGCSGGCAAVHRQFQRCTRLSRGWTVHDAAPTCHPIPSLPPATWMAPFGWVMVEIWRYWEVHCHGMGNAQAMHQNEGDKVRNGR